MKSAQINSGDSINQKKLSPTPKPEKHEPNRKEKEDDVPEQDPAPTIKDPQKADPLTIEEPGKKDPVRILPTK